LILFRAIYAAVILWLAVYSLQALVLTLLYLRHRHEERPSIVVQEDSWPLVAVQLPVCNEQHVIERLIDAAAALDYPHDRLEIQILDDSSDATTALAQARAAHYRARGINVQVLRRPARVGFKAGALAWGLAHTRAEFLAVFDADFSPRPDFLRRTIPYMLADPSLGLIQTRWSHLNYTYSPLTRVQALALDGHFVVEQTGRNRAGLLINFNGSGGVWRRSCIESVGGWQADTMTEDMDLSYRAQLAGWRALYLPDVDAPAELPPQMEAFKRQQARWAQGSVQCLRKLGLRVIRSRLSVPQKVMALLHMSSYLAQPLMVLWLLVMLPLLLHAELPRGPVVGLGLVGLGLPMLYIVATRALYPDWKRRILYFPLLAAVATGITWSTSRAVWEGLTRWGGIFQRTPKFRLEGRHGQWHSSVYRLWPDRTVVGELILLLYALATMVVAVLRGAFGTLPFLLLYVIGYAMAAGASLWQGRQRSAGHLGLWLVAKVPWPWLRAGACSGPPTAP